VLTDKSEFVFVDESGDPGEGGNPIYIMAAVHVPDDTQRQVRTHLTSFRYHHGVTKELKDTGALKKDKFTPPMRSLLEFIAQLTDAGEITATTNWLDKNLYKGPHPPGPTA
jgi:hypothetical protein